jgi:hypothetical protein
MKNLNNNSQTNQNAEFSNQADNFNISRHSSSQEHRNAEVLLPVSLNHHLDSPPKYEEVIELSLINQQTTSNTI